MLMVVRDGWDALSNGVSTGWMKGLFSVHCEGLLAFFWSPFSGNLSRAIHASSPLVPAFLPDLSVLAFLCLFVFSPLQPFPCCENFTTPLVSLPVGPSPKPLLEQKWRFSF